MKLVLLLLVIGGIILYIINSPRHKLTRRLRRAAREGKPITAAKGSGMSWKTGQDIYYKEKDKMLQKRNKM